MSTYGGPSVDRWPIKQDLYDSDRPAYLHAISCGSLQATAIDYVPRVSYTIYNTLTVIVHVICVSNGAFTGFAESPDMPLAYLYYSYHQVNQQSLLCNHCI